MALRVVERLAQREASWHALDALLDRLARPGSQRPSTAEVLQLGALYRAACTDLMLAEAHDLPREAVGYLHGLVGRAHNALYRAQGFKFSDWAAVLFRTVPRQLRHDPALRLAALVFWGSFLICALLAAGRPDFGPVVAGEAFLGDLDEMYATPPGERWSAGEQGTAGTGFYIAHNASIGLSCFAWGLCFGLGTLYQLLFNGMLLGTAFGYMARGPNAVNFFTFVTAHGPFELTAIVFSGAAGFRLGWGLIDTQGQTRLASLRREAERALPTIGAAVLLFVLAAFLEGYVSPSPLPYAVKAGIALGAAALLVAYMMLGGRGGEDGKEAPHPPFGHLLPGGEKGTKSAAAERNRGAGEYAVALAPAGRGSG